MSKTELRVVKKALTLDDACKNLRVMVKLGVEHLDARQLKIKQDAEWSSYARRIKGGKV